MVPSEFLIVVFSSFSFSSVVVISVEVCENGIFDGCLASHQRLSAAGVSLR